MPISRETVDYVARLSRLDLTAEERELFTRQLGEILAAVEKINELDVSGVEPAAAGPAPGQAFRADEPRPSLSPAEALANAPDRQEDFFRLPRVVGE